MTGARVTATRGRSKRESGYSRPGGSASRRRPGGRTRSIGAAKRRQSRDHPRAAVGAMRAMGQFQLRPARHERVDRLEGCRRRQAEQGPASGQAHRLATARRQAIVTDAFEPCMHRSALRGLSGIRAFTKTCSDALGEGVKRRPGLSGERQRLQKLAADVSHRRRAPRVLRGGSGRAQEGVEGVEVAFPVRCRGHARTMCSGLPLTRRRPGPRALVRLPWVPAYAGTTEAVISARTRAGVSGPPRITTP